MEKFFWHLRTHNMLSTELPNIEAITDLRNICNQLESIGQSYSQPAYLLRHTCPKAIEAGNSATLICLWSIFQPLNASASPAFGTVDFRKLCPMQPNLPMQLHRRGQAERERLLLLCTVIIENEYVLYQLYTGQEVAAILLHEMCSYELGPGLDQPLQPPAGTAHANTGCTQLACDGLCQCMAAVRVLFYNVRSVTRWQAQPACSPCALLSSSPRTPRSTRM